MNRRKFIKTSSFGSVAIGLGFSSSYDLLKHDNLIINKSINPIVPFRFFPEEEEKMLLQLIEMKRKYGLSRFLLVAPTDEVRFEGYPPNSIFHKIGEEILFVKNKLEAEGIEIGWWCAPSLRMGSGGPFQYITDVTGVVSKSTPCPLDSNFKKDFSEKIGIVTKIVRPFRIQFEDDFEVSWHPPEISFGCFCPLHLLEFSKQQKKEYTRESLQSIFKSVTPESMRLRREWAVMTKETLVDFAISIRNSVDKIDPSISITLCQSGAADFDGDFTKEVTQALAGKTQPSVRLYGAGYSTDDLLSLPKTLFHLLYSKQHLPANFELLHEADTYPHTRYFTSANMMQSLLTGIFSYGLDDILFYATQYLDNPLEDRGYVNMYKKESVRLSVLKNIVKDCDVVGCEVVYNPSAHITNPYNSNVWDTIYYNDWVQSLGRYGIPYTSKNGKVKFLSGNIFEMMPGNEIQTLLKGGVFLDGVAAHSLFKKGYGDLIGIKDIKQGVKADFCFESIRHPDKYPMIEGKLMYNLIFSGTGSEIGGDFYEIDPMKITEVITDFVDFKNQPVIPGMISFENEIGGRVAITSFDLSKNESSTIFNYKKKELIRQTIHWLGKEALPVCIMNRPNVFCIFNQSRNNKYGIITVFNMTADIYDSFDIAVADQWSNIKIESLEESGNWKSVNFTDNENVKKIHVSLTTLSPVIFKLTQL